MSEQDTHAELVERATDCLARLAERHTEAPTDNTKQYQKAVSESDGSMGWGYDAELDSRSEETIRDLLAALESEREARRRAEEVVEKQRRLAGVYRTIGAEMTSIEWMQELERKANAEALVEVMGGE